MTTSTGPTTAATGPLFDVSNVSVAAYSAQQGIAPFDAVLQQVRTPSPPPNANPPQKALDPPPPKDNRDDAERRSNASASGDTVNDGSTAAATNDDQAETASAPQQNADLGAKTDQPDNSHANQAASSQAAHAVSNTRSTSATAKVKTVAQKTSSAAAEPRSDRRTAQAVTAQVETNAKTTVSSKTTDDKQQNDKQELAKTPQSQAVADKTATLSPAVVADAVFVPPPQTAAAAEASETNVATQEVNGKAKGAAKPASTDSQITKQTLVAARQNPALLETITNRSGSPAPSAHTSPQAQPAAGRGSPGESQNARPAFNEAAIKATPNAELTAQSTATIDDTVATNSVALATPDAASVAVDATQAVSTIAADLSKQPESTVVQTSTSSAPAPTEPIAPASSTANANFAAPSTLTTSLSHSAPADSSPTGGLSTIDRARFVQRVTRAFQTVGDAGGQIRLRLSPPDLGSLQLQISVKQGALTAHIQTDTNSAQQVLLDSLPELRDRLAQQDIRIDRFDVELAGQSSGGMPQSPQGNPDFNQAQQRTIISRAAPTAAATSGDNSPAQAVSLLTSGALDVVV